MGVLKLLFCMCILVIVGNLLVYAFLLFTPMGRQVADEGVVLRIGNRAWIFAHGKYVYEENRLRFAHITFWKNTTVFTGDLVREIKATGVEKVWMSQCESGDWVYSYFDFERGIAERWGVNINRGSGVSVPFFTGVGFVRIPLPVFVQKSGL